MQGFTKRTAFLRWQSKTRKKATRRSRAAAALAAMRTNIARRLLVAWSGAARLDAAHRRLLLPILQRMRNACLASALDEWRQEAARRARSRGKLQRCLQASHHPGRVHRSPQPVLHSAWLTRHFAQTHRQLPNV